MSYPNVFDMSVPVEELAARLNLTDAEKRSLAMAHPYPSDLEGVFHDSQYAKGRIVAMRLVDPMMYRSERHDDTCICFQRSSAGQRLLDHYIAQGFVVPELHLTMVDENRMPTQAKAQTPG